MNFKKYTWWEIGIFLVGMLSLASLLVIFFLPLGTGPATFTTTAPVPAVSSPQFLQTLSDSLALPLEKGDPITILNNGDGFLQSFLPDIDSARSSINVMLYNWDPGVMSNQVLEHLDAKLKQGVEVRVMLDGFAAAGMTKRPEFKTFQSLGGKVGIFHPLTFAPWSIVRNPQRNHRRAIVIDGTIGYTGGEAISDLWAGDARNPKEYRDMIFRSTGSMAHDIQGAFAELWASSTGEILLGNKFYPPVSAPKTSALSFIPLVSTPSVDTLTMQKFILLSLLGAQHSIFISDPYFLPDQSFREALKAKAKAGVDVRILLPNDYNDEPGVRHASENYYAELLASGVKIYEYQPTFIHTKTIVIDGTWSIIGSANLDNRSRKLNEEDIFGVSDQSFGAALEKTFNEDLTHAIQINLSDWNKRSLWQRIREAFALKFVQQY